MKFVRILYNNIKIDLPKIIDRRVVKYLWFLPDKLYLSLRYRLKMGRWINWKHPKLFTEKIQWLKVYVRKDEYTMMVDKYAVKQYVGNIIGEDYIIPTLGVWNQAEDIDWNALPNQFVLKTTHGGGSGEVIVCKDKNRIDKFHATSILEKSLKSGDIYRVYREWPYKNVKRRIIAERYVDPMDSAELSDYKFFCFNGEPKYCQVIRDRHTKETIDFYDMEWNHMPFVGLNPKAQNGNMPVPKPAHLDDMIDICRKLSIHMCFVRIDLYAVKEKVYFGEITFYPASGFGVFTPNNWDEKLGDLISLPITR